MLKSSFVLLFLSTLIACGNPEPVNQVGLRGREARALVQSLQARGAKAEDHIPEFANLISSHIEHIETGLKDTANLMKGWDIHEKRATKIKSEDKRIWTPRVEAALVRLAALKAESQSKIADRKVTYEWWITFNWRLAAISDLGLGADIPLFVGSFFDNLRHGIFSHENTLALLSEIPFFFQNVDLRSHVADFPRTIFIPTVSTLDLADFNELRATGGYFLGLVNGISTADGSDVSPAEFLTHDAFHALISLLNPNKAPANDWLSMVYREHASQLSSEKRAAVDVTFFLYDHEDIPHILFNENGRYELPSDLKFCEGCDKDTILDYFPKDIRKQGRQASQEWLNAATKETEEFFYAHRPDKRPAA